MADGFVQVPPDSTGKLIDTSEITTTSGLVERQRVAIPDVLSISGDTLTQILIEQRVQNLLLSQGLNVLDGIDALRNDVSNVVVLSPVRFVEYNAGTISGGTYTPLGSNGNYHFYTNNGAHTLANPPVDSAMDILITNSGSAGTITFSGFTVSANVGDALDTVNLHMFIISIRRINNVSTYTIKALQ